MKNMKELWEKLPRMKCQQCGKAQGEDNTTFTWRPRYVNLCEDCYCDLRDNEERENVELERLVH